MAEIFTIFLKEWYLEKRTPSGFYISLLFSLLAVVAVSFASYGFVPSPSLSAGMLSVILLFSNVLTVPRTFLIEEEQSTFHLLKLLASPAAIFLGKTLYNFVQALVMGGLLSILFITFTGVTIQNTSLFVAVLLGKSLALCSSISFCSALSMGASNKWILATVLSLPLLLPQTILGVGALRVALGEGSFTGGLQNTVGLYGFAVAMLFLGLVLVQALWRNE